MLSREEWVCLSLSFLLWLIAKVHSTAFQPWGCGFSILQCYFLYACMKSKLSVNVAKLWPDSKIGWSLSNHQHLNDKLSAFWIEKLFPVFHEGFSVKSWNYFARVGAGWPAPCGLAAAPACPLVWPCLGLAEQAAAACAPSSLRQHR